MKHNTPLVTVIVTTYNRKNLLPDALASILKQTYTNYEIIIVNDKGEDVWDVVKQFESANIKLLSHIRNSGIAFARNTGLLNAAGEIVFYLDDDDIFLPNHIELLVSNMIDSNVSCAYSTLEFIDEIIENEQRIEINRNQPYHKNEFVLEDLQTANFISCQCFAHKHSIINEIGLYDESFTVFEDWDFFLKCAETYTILHIMEVTTEVRRRVESKEHLFAGSNYDGYDYYKKIYDKHNENLTDRVKKIRQGILLDLVKRKKGMKENITKWQYRSLLAENYMKYYFLMFKQAVLQPKDLISFVMKKP